MHDGARTSSKAEHQAAKRRWTPKVRTGCRTCKYDLPSLSVVAISPALISRRTRRIKCDEIKPTCRRCRTGGYNCSGWGYGDSPPPGTAVSQMPKTVPASPSSLPQLDGSAACRDIILLGPLLSSRDLHPSSLLPHEAKAQFLMSRSKRLASYVFHIPSRSGHNSTLDSAVACVAAVVREVYSYEGTPSKFRCSAQSLALYGLALQNLHTSLQSAERSLEAETLCATELLGLFEVYLTG